METAITVTLTPSTIKNVAYTLQTTLGSEGRGAFIPKALRELSDDEIKELRVLSARFTKLMSDRTLALSSISVSYEVWELLSKLNGSK